MNYTKDPYTAEWTKVQEEESKGLPRTALKEISVIYRKAKKDNNPAQIVKALINRLKYQSQFEEEEFIKSMSELKEESLRATFPSKPMLHSMLAEMYWNYYDRNRWRFANRTATVGFKQEDIRTWDLRKIVETCDSEYEKSLESANESQSIPIDLYDDVLYVGYRSREFNPTLYDFLINRAISFYTNNQSSLPVPKEEFKIDYNTIFFPKNQPSRKEFIYYADASRFVEAKLVTSDLSSFKYKSIKLYQDFLKFKLLSFRKSSNEATADQSLAALIDIDLKRLKYIHDNNFNKDNDSLYLLSLSNLQKKYSTNKASAQVSYNIANYHYAIGAKYTLGGSVGKLSFLEAEKICKETVGKFTSSDGTENCLSLLSQIYYPNITITTEKINVPDKPSKVLVKYKNVPEIHFHIFPLDDKDLDAIRKEYNRLSAKYEYRDYFSLVVDHYSTKKAIETFSEKLPLDGEFHEHSAEVKLPSLQTGEYIVFASTSSKLTYDKSAVGMSIINQSRIAYIHRDATKFKEFYVMDRETGEPLKGVNAQVYEIEYNSKKGIYESEKGDSYESDKNGYFEIPLTGKKYIQYYIELTYGKDVLYINNTEKLNAYQYMSGIFYKWERYNEAQEYTQHITHFFTDRAIYRPGQTLFFKGILISKIGSKSEILKNASSMIQLMNPNHQKAGELTVTTNEFGSFSGSFIIPNTGLNGQFYITNASYGGQSQYFSVEDYKRPKFEVNFVNPKGSYRLKDKVKVEGKALSFSGANVDGASVKYRVVRTAVIPYWWRWFYYNFDYSSSPQMEILQGETKTDEKGEFFVEFEAIPDESIKGDGITFDYNVTADVIDINGETRTGNKLVKVGYTSLVIGSDIPDDLDKANTKTFKIKSTNLSGEVENSKGKIAIYKLKSPNSAYRSRRWNIPDKFIYTREDWEKNFPYESYQDESNVSKFSKETKVLDISYDTSKSSDLKLANIEKWDAGQYVIEMNSKDKFGEEVKEIRYFLLTAFSSSKLALPNIDYFRILNRTAEPGDKVKIVVNTTNKTKALFEIEHKNKIIHSEWVDEKKLSSSDIQQRIFEIPIKEEYRGGVSVHYTFINENRLYTHNETIVVPYTNKQLDISFETFRDKLLPGAKEEWKIKIKAMGGEKAVSEMLATLYDASLDTFRKNFFNFSIYDSFYATRNWQSVRCFDTGNFQQYEQNWRSTRGGASYGYDSLNWFGYYFQHNNYHQYNKRARNGGGGRARAEEGEMDMMADAPSMSKAAPAPMAAEEKSMDKEVAPGKPLAEPISTASTTIPPPPPGDVSPTTGTGEGSVQPRTNFNETAFFYPQLRTDAEGNLIISFQVPESLTKWKMLGLAHTQDLKFGMVEKELVTQKELMVVPNTPRFFREGDTIHFAAKITNLSDKELAGQVKLNLFDAVSGEPIDKLFKSSTNKLSTDNLNFNAKIGQSDAVEWEMKIPDGITAITYRVTASSGKFADGEEMAVPVLTNRMLVTETMPLPIRGVTTKNYTFEKLVNSVSPVSKEYEKSTLKHHKLTLEFTANPVWYAVQSLPYLMEYPYECIEQTFSRYYANSLSAHIVKSNPKIKKVFEAWQAVPDTEKGALSSNLEKNQELKSLMLEETPWVLDAQDESLSKKRVALLFDILRMSAEMEKALKKIKEFQLYEGAWTWFKGMGPDRFMTQHIITGMGHLDHLGVTSVRSDSSNWDMMTRAMGYMDRKIIDDHEDLKKLAARKLININDNHLGYLQIHYIYSRSYFMDIPIPKESKEAVEYFKGQAEKYWTQNSFYMQGMLALGLNRFGDKKTPAAIVASIREHALHSEEMGMYWKYDGGYYWYQMPTETQSLMVEVFHEVANDDKAVDDIKTWLIKNKQTNDWKTTKATSEAVYALLLRGADWLNEDKGAEITLGNNKKIDSTKVEGAEAGTGYFKLSYDTNEIRPEMGNVQINKLSRGVSWGALYWQYFENLDKITSAETPLKLKKQLFLQKNSPTGPVLTPINDKSKLKVGDLLKVRVELRVDRDMEYVHMKDMRASGFEPINVMSQYKYQDGLGYYESTRDAATNFFFGFLPKGTFVFEYPLRVTHKGDFSNGITTIQSMYAPEFTSHSEGIRVKVE